MLARRFFGVEIFAPCQKRPALKPDHIMWNCHGRITAATRSATAAAPAAFG
jgi:hypothetical protein